MWQAATHPPAEKPKSQIFSRLLAPLFSQALAAPVGGPLARSRALISIASPRHQLSSGGRKRKMWKRAKESSLTYDGARPCPKPLFAGTMHFAGPKKNARLAESLDEPPTSPEPPQQATLLASGNLHLASLLLQPGYPSEDIMATPLLQESPRLCLLKHVVSLYRLNISSGISGFFLRPRAPVHELR